ncbi:hypothetical protein [Morganella morganii]|uniref:hypothetical protein n=1 Tax=Morganella morganii TaxID=582 RepID=UPI001BD955C3|nr:hypothetical protein [Morganella morganii]MBT0363619.1 hypothetical protein [Morganella morganii subsp. morganii]
MKDRIKFSDEMLAAVIAVRKTQTRRIMKPQPVLNGNFYEVFGAGWSKGIKRVTVAPGHSLERNFPYGLVDKKIPFADKDGNIKGEIEIADVWVQRVQDISQADAIAEGAPHNHPSIDSVSRYFGFPDFPRSWFGQTWWHIYGEKAWKDNPWVWVIEFKRVKE